MNFFPCLCWKVSLSFLFPTWEFQSQRSDMHWKIFVKTLKEQEFNLKLVTATSVHTQFVCLYKNVLVSIEKYEW